MSFFTAEEIADLKGELEAALPHTYTRKTAAEDVYGHSQTPVTTTGLRCRYTPAGRPSVSDAGDMAPDLPTLDVLSTDTLAVGDLVSNVRSEGGARVLLVGPEAVQRTEDLDSTGTVMLRRADLGSAQVA